MMQAAARYAGDIHLLATDVIMPRMGGKALATELLKQRPAMKVLFMSGYTADTILNHGVLDPGTNLIAKPFMFIELSVKALNYALRSRLASLQKAA